MEEQDYYNERAHVFFFLRYISDITSQSAHPLVDATRKAKSKPPHEYFVGMSSLRFLHSSRTQARALAITFPSFSA